MEFLLGAIDSEEYGELWCDECKNEDMEIDIFGYDAEDKEETAETKSDENLELNLTGITFPTTRALLTDPNVFIADTGSTVHSTRFKSGIKKAKKGTDDDAITMGNGAREGAAMIGDLSGIMCSKEGNEMGEATLKDVAYLPTSKFNLFSVTKLQRNGWILHGDRNQIKLTKGDKSVVFDIVIDTPKGAIYAMYLKRNTELASAAADGTMTTGRQQENQMTIKQAHDRFGHANEEATRAAAKHAGITITKGTLKVCEACAIAKARQKNVPKHNATHEKARVFPERVFLDIATVKQKEDQPKVTKPNWRIIVDEATNLKFSDFYETKNGMVEPTCELLNKWKQNGKIVKFMRMDNAGENRKLQD
jgi:hypothetical protein